MHLEAGFEFGSCCMRVECCAIWMGLRLQNMFKNATYETWWR